MKMESLLRTVGTAVQDACRAIEYNAMGQFFDTYFDRTQKEGGKIAYTPKIIEVEIPSPGTGKAGKVLYTPTAALVRHKSMHLDCVRLQLNIDAVEDADGAEEGLQVSPRGACPPEDAVLRQNAGTLEITLKCSDAAEGIARIETQLHGML